MERLFFEDLGDTESVVTNSVVLVLGECQMSMAGILLDYHGPVTRCDGGPCHRSICALVICQPSRTRILRIILVNNDYLRIILVNNHYLRIILVNNRYLRIILVNKSLPTDHPGQQPLLMDHLGNQPLLTDHLGHRSPARQVRRHIPHNIRQMAPHICPWSTLVSCTILLNNCGRNKGHNY